MIKEQLNSKLNKYGFSYVGNFCFLYRPIQLGTLQKIAKNQPFSFAIVCFFILSTEYINKLSEQISKCFDFKQHCLKLKCYGNERTYIGAKHTYYKVVYCLLT